MTLPCSSLTRNGIFVVNPWSAKPFWASSAFEWEVVRQLSGVLPAGKILRIHSGKGPHGVVRDEDKAGSDYYFFTEESRYIWNNDYGDASLLWIPVTRKTIDQADYDSYPPEGVVLQRVGDKLVAPSSVASRW